MVEGPKDWSEEHDHYLYGTHPSMKRGEDNNMNGTRFFLDTAYVLALLNPYDVYHKQAKAPYLLTWDKEKVVKGKITCLEDFREILR